MDAKAAYQAAFDEFLAEKLKTATFGTASDVVALDSEPVVTAEEERTLYINHLTEMFDRACQIMDTLDGSKIEQVQMLHDSLIPPGKSDCHTIVPFTHGRDENGEVIALIGPRWLSYLRKFDRFNAEGQPESGRQTL